MSSRIGAMLLLAPLLAGCESVQKYSLTYNLWETDDLRKWSEPAPSSNLALFEATDHADVLVEYDALSEQHSTVKRQAYYLQLNEARVAAGKKPALVDPALADGRTAIPVLDAQVVGTNPPAPSTPYAVTAKEGRQFTLYQHPQTGETFDLPVYPERSGTFTRVALTPFAVAGDTVMVGAVASVVGFFVWISMGAPGTNVH